MIGQIFEYKAEFLSMIQSVNLPSSAHTITFSAHCSHAQLSAAIYNHLHLQPILSSAHCSYTIHCTLQLYHPVHTAAILSSAHCSYTIQCTLQLYYPVHTAAILFSAQCSYTIQCTLQLYYPVHTAAIPSIAHCSYTIQCTLQLHYLVSIPYSASSAPLDHHRVSLYHYWPTSRAVSRH